MKPAAFDYEKPRSLDAAVKLLATSDGAAKVIAGGQSLTPVLNFRLAQPSLLVDVRGLPELAGVKEEADAIVLGATTTHAQIEDGRVPDPTNGLLRRVARGIAYRAVRNRGTLGGSLAHADPAADWLNVMALLDAEVLVQRRVRVPARTPEALVGSAEPLEWLERLGCAGLLDQDRRLEDRSGGAFGIGCLASQPRGDDTGEQSPHWTRTRRPLPQDAELAQLPESKKT